ncbi:uncharacterized protein [Medicago truncatula]|uniref:uncharacterized protein isoform X2 n=1 Tax=Medicago truncatula TaxID=3880 RepID=UPI0019680A60|nr:uncharacterized protein LOC11443110 isoform X2 [Medicago truncatula]
MVQLCFVLDLRTLAPPLLGDLKQSLLQLANFYAISNSSLSSRKSDTLSDKIGLCYVVKNRLSSSDELMIAYRPVGNFNLRDFHHAVNNLPSDAFLPDIDTVSDVMISDVLSERVLYSWQGKDIERKVIVITSILPEDVNFVMQKSLTDAADRCVSVDFAVFQPKSSHLIDSRENINNFRRSISHLDNCSVQTYITDFRSFNGLVKRWLQVLKDDMDKPLLARLIFKDDLLDSVNHIFCNLLPPVNPITNSISQCQTCRCHGIPLDDAGKKLNMFSCSVTGSNLETCDVNENSVCLGGKTILFLPSFHNSLKLLPIYSPINVTVTERINLASLDEVFQGLSSILHSMDQGLICSSNCDLETMTEAPYHCYYILQPSDNGPMLMRRIAGAEEVKQSPDYPLIDPSVNKDVENSVQACLLKIDLTDYDPLLHERGFHQKLNVLVKESLKLGSVFPKMDGAFSELSSTRQPSSEVIGRAESATNVIGVDEGTLSMDITDQDDRTMAYITEEWKQLVVSEEPKLYSPSCIPKAKLDQSSISPRNGIRQLDKETSRILERLEVPRPSKGKKASPVSNESCMKNIAVPTKKPLIPFLPTQNTEQVIVGSQLMKPNFQRQKRKQR